MDEFKKIDLAPSTQKVDIQGAEKKPMTRTTRERRLRKKPLLITLGVLFVLFLLSLFVVILPAQKVYKSAMKTYAQAKVTFDAVKKQNVEQASVELTKTQKELAQTKKDLQALSYLKFIPIANWYYNDADHLTSAGAYGLDAATILLNSVKPYADILGLKGQGSFVMGSAEDRIRTAILTMGKITPKIDDVAGSLKKARDEVDQVDPNHYPDFIAKGKVKQQLTQLREMTDLSVVFIDQARPLIKVLPSLLGESKEKRYLILFQNDKELRPAGGFITAYSVFRIDKGIIHVDKSDDIYTLDNTITNKPKAPAIIAKYLPSVPTFNLRDSNISPDFIESMKLFNGLYDKARGKIDVDGIIAIDTSVLVSTIKILDDEVVAGGIKFTSKEDKRCSCPQVIYVLEDEISRPVNYVKTGRKDLLGTLLYAIMEKAMKSSPKQYWGPLFQDMLTQTEQKHVLFYIYNKDAQDGIEALNAAGRIKETEGDYLHINEANFAGAKSNMYIKEAVEQKYEIGSDQSITKTITINYKNPFPPSDCNLERGGLCLNAIHRDFVRVYVPKGSTLVSSEGSGVKVTAGEDLGKTVFEGFLEIRPKGVATYKLTYKLPFKLAKDSVLPLLIQKQPGTYNNAYTILNKGKTLQTFDLLTDKELQLSL